jgi:hypothetical protein
MIACIFTFVQQDPDPDQVHPDSRCLSVSLRLRPSLA